MTTLPNLDDLMRLARACPTGRITTHAEALAVQAFTDAASPAVVVGLVRVAMAAQLVADSFIHAERYEAINEARLDLIDDLQVALSNLNKRGDE